MRRRPMSRDAARLRGERKNKCAPCVGVCQNRRGACLGGIAPRSSGLDLQTLERRQGLQQCSAPPIKNVIVTEHAAVDPRGDEAVGVLGAHPVVDAFGDIGVAARNAGFKIYNARVRPSPLQFLQRCAPDVGEVDRRRYRLVRRLRHPDIVDGRLHIALVKTRVTRMWKRLVYASPRHYIATEKDPHDAYQPGPSRSAMPLMTRRPSSIARVHTSEDHHRSYTPTR